MYKFVVTFQTKPGGLKAILAAAPLCLAATRKEAGCLSYDFFVSVDRPDSFVAVEAFKDKEAHATHGATPHFLAFLPVLEENVASWSLEPLATDSA